MAGTQIYHGNSSADGKIFHGETYPGLLVIFNEISRDI